MDRWTRNAPRSWDRDEDVKMMEQYIAQLEAKIEKIGMPPEVTAAGRMMAGPLTAEAVPVPNPKISAELILKR